MLHKLATVRNFARKAYNPLVHEQKLKRQVQAEHPESQYYKFTPDDTLLRLNKAESLQEAKMIKRLEHDYKTRTGIEEERD